MRYEYGYKYKVEMMDRESDWKVVGRFDTLLKAVDFIYREFRARNPKLVDEDIWDMDDDGFSHDAVIIVNKIR